MSNIESLGKKAGDATMMRPEDTLNEAIDSLSVGGELEHVKKVLVLALDDSNDEYNVSFFQAGMKASQCVTLCEVGKAVFLRDMDYI